MVELSFLSQLVNAMDDAANKLEIADKAGKRAEIMRLKVFIFDLYRQIDSALIGRKND